MSTANVLSVDSETDRFPGGEPTSGSQLTSKSAPQRPTVVGLGYWLVALVDQGLVSGTRFLTTIIIGRYCGAGELGTYSLAFSLLVLACCIQEAIITTPYAVFGPRLRRRSRTTYAGAIARMHFGLAIASALFLFALALIASLLQLHTLRTIALALAVTLPCSLAMEFVRRFALAELDVKSAALLDATVTLIQLVLLTLLATVNWLSAAVALWAVAIAYLVPATIWWVLHSKSRVRADSLASRYWGRNWTLGRWLLASQLMAIIHGFMPAWLLAVLVNTHATGEFMIYLNLALLANPILFAVGSLLTPRTAHALARGGPREAQQLVLRVSLYLVALMSIFAIGLSVGGHSLIQLIYGHPFGGSVRVASLLGLTTIMWAISTTCASGLVAFGRPRWGFLARFFGSIVTAVSMVVLAPRLTIYGATLAVFLGSFTAAAIHGWAFIRVRRAYALSDRGQRSPITTIAS